MFLKLPRQRGFTLVELMVVVSVIAILAVLAMPSLFNSIKASRERSVVEKFSQDYSWVRAQASLNATSQAQLTVNADCTWTAQVAGVTDAAHSMTAATLVSTVSGFACTAGTMALPAYLCFNPQGALTTTATTACNAAGVSSGGTFTLTGASGQSWPLQVLRSGAVIRTAGAS